MLFGQVDKSKLNLEAFAAAPFGAAGPGPKRWIRKVLQEQRRKQIKDERRRLREGVRRITKGCMNADEFDAGCQLV